MPTAAELDAAFTTARDALETQRANAQGAGELGVAAVLEAALADLRERRKQVRAADLLLRWTAERAVQTLTTATPAIAARLSRRGTALIELADGGRLDVAPLATREPSAGYIVAHRSRSGELVARYRATDNPALVTIVRTVLDAVAAR